MNATCNPPFPGSLGSTAKQAAIAASVGGDGPGVTRAAAERAAGKETAATHSRQLQLQCAPLNGISSVHINIYTGKGWLSHRYRRKVISSDSCSLRNHSGGTPALQMTSNGTEAILRRCLIRAGRVVGALAPYTAASYGAGRFTARADAAAAAAAAAAPSRKPYHAGGDGAAAAASKVAAAGAAAGTAGGGSLLEQLVGSNNQFATGGVTLMVLGAALAAGRSALVYRWGTVGCGGCS
jgi:hypothetical protein